MMHEEPEIDEGQVRLVRASQTEYAWQDEKGDLTPLRGDVRFENVTFGYVPEKKVLDGISLYAKPGQKDRVCGLYRSREDYDH